MIPIRLTLSLWYYEDFTRNVWLIKGLATKLFTEKHNRHSECWKHFVNWTSSENIIPIDEFTQFDDTITSRCNGARFSMECMRS